MTRFICVTCGVQFDESEAPPEICPICTDERQYVREGGQAWTTLDELRADHKNEVRQDGDFAGVGTEPWFGIGQRALLVPFGEQVVMWDCTLLADDTAVKEIEARGGLAGIAISHPHYYSTMADWAERFDCPVWLHAADRRWVMQPSERLEFWDGEFRGLGHGLTLVRGGGHFAGGTMLHVGRTLLSGDIVQVIPDRRFVGFMYSYPNLIPLPEAAVRHIESALSGFDFDAIYGAWWGRIVPEDGKAVVARAAARYVRALAGDLPPGA
jgi:hypothetical protein